MKKKTTKSSGNVFVDLGFDPAEAAVLQMRARRVVASFGSCRFPVQRTVIRKRSLF